MRTLRTLIGVVVTLAVLSTSSALLQAHMKLEKSEPAADAVVKEPLKHVQVFFSEAPDLKVSKLEIKGPSAQTKLVQLHVMGNSLMAMVEGDMPDGAYTISWQAAGDDGHIQKGEISFTLKRA
ncbi:MAG: copper resistance protein CopC [Vicinamibacterales bacterium]